MPEAADGRPSTKQFQCPYCNSYDVARLFVAPLSMDSCECLSCSARWDEDCATGTYKGRGDRASVLMRRQL